VICLASLCLAPLAQAVPVHLSHSGRLLDAAGVPVNGVTTLAADLFAGEVGGVSLYATSAAVDVQQGFYTLVLGTGPVLDSRVLALDQLWLEVKVNGVVVGPRSQILEVPRAVTAINVRGGEVILPAVGACDAGRVGSVIFDGFELKVCDGAAFQRLGAQVTHGVVNTGGVRQWGDGARAASCADYLTPGAGYTYSGDVGDGLYRVDPAGATGPFEVLCDMTGGGWQLIYGRDNGYFTPDHMIQGAPPARLDGSVSSTSWYIPAGASTWRWEVSVDAGATYRHIVSDIPSQALNAVHAAVANQPVTVTSNTSGATGTFYYQTFPFSSSTTWGCGSNAGSWYGLVNATQGAGDQANPGIGGHCDGCTLGAFAAPGEYTYGDGNLEIYYSDWKNVQGNGAGGTNCVPTADLSLYRVRFWAR